MKFAHNSALAGLIPQFIDNHVEDKQDVQHSMVFALGDLPMTTYAIEI